MSLILTCMEMMLILTQMIKTMDMIVEDVIQPVNANPYVSLGRTAISLHSRRALKNVG